MTTPTIQPEKLLQIIGEEVVQRRLAQEQLMNMAAQNEALNKQLQELKGKKDTEK